MAYIYNASTLTMRWEKETRETREVAEGPRASYPRVSHAGAERRETQ